MDGVRCALDASAATARPVTLRMYHSNVAFKTLNVDLLCPSPVDVSEALGSEGVCNAVCKVAAAFLTSPGPGGRLPAFATHVIDSRKRRVTFFVDADSPWKVVVNARAERDLPNIVSEATRVAGRLASATNRNCVVRLASGDERSKEAVTRVVRQLRGRWRVVQADRVHVSCELSVTCDECVARLEECGAWYGDAMVSVTDARTDMTLCCADGDICVTRPRLDQWHVRCARRRPRDALSRWLGGGWVVREMMRLFVTPIDSDVLARMGLRRKSEEEEY